MHSLMVYRALPPRRLDVPYMCHTFLTSLTDEETAHSRTKPALALSTSFRSIDQPLSFNSSTCRLPFISLKTSAPRYDLLNSLHSTPIRSAKPDPTTLS